MNMRVTLTTEVKAVLDCFDKHKKTAFTEKNELGDAQKSFGNTVITATEYDGSRLPGIGRFVNATKHLLNSGELYSIPLKRSPDLNIESPHAGINLGYKDIKGFADNVENYVKKKITKNRIPNSKVLAVLILLTWASEIWLIDNNKERLAELRKWRDFSDALLKMEDLTRTNKTNEMTCQRILQQASTIYRNEVKRVTILEKNDAYSEAIAAMYPCEKVGGKYTPGRFLGVFNNALFQIVSNEAIPQGFLDTLGGYDWSLDFETFRTRYVTVRGNLSQIALDSDHASLVNSEEKYNTIKAMFFSPFDLYTKIEEHEKLCEKADGKSKSSQEVLAAVAKAEEIHEILSNPTADDVRKTFSLFSKANVTPSEAFYGYLSETLRLRNGMIFLDYYMRKLKRLTKKAGDIGLILANPAINALVESINITLRNANGSIESLFHELRGYCANNAAIKSAGLERWRTNCLTTSLDSIDEHITVLIKSAEQIKVSVNDHSQIDSAEEINELVKSLHQGMAVLGRRPDAAMTDESKNLMSHIYYTANYNVSRRMLIRQKDERLKLAESQYYASQNFLGQPTDHEAGSWVEYEKAYQIQAGEYAAKRDKELEDYKKERDQQDAQRYIQQAVQISMRHKAGAEELQAEIDRLKGASATYKESLNELDKKLEKSQQTIDKLKKDLKKAESLEQQVEVHKSTIANFEQLKVILNKKASEALDENKSLKTHNEELNGKVTSMSAKVADADNVIEERDNLVRDKQELQHLVDSSKPRLYMVDMVSLIGDTSAKSEKNPLLKVANKKIKFMKPTIWDRDLSKHLQNYYKDEEVCKTINSETDPDLVVYAYKCAAKLESIANLSVAYTEGWIEEIKQKYFWQRFHHGKSGIKRVLASLKNADDMTRSLQKTMGDEIEKQLDSGQPLSKELLEKAFTDTIKQEVLLKTANELKEGYVSKIKKFFGFTKRRKSSYKTWQLNFLDKVNKAFVSTDSSYIDADTNKINDCNLFAKTQFDKDVVQAEVTKQVTALSEEDVNQQLRTYGVAAAAA